jgi:hypothetical protein
MIPLPRTITIPLSANAPPPKPTEGAKNAPQKPKTTKPLLPPSLQPLAPPSENWVKTGTQYYETLIQEEEKIAQQIPIYQAWQSTVSKLNPPQTHLNAFHKPIIEAKEKEHHPWDFLNNTMSLQATLWPILLAGYSLYENADGSNATQKLATDAVKASDESSHVFASHMSEGAFQRFRQVENWLAPIATALTVYNAVCFGHEAYKRSKKQTNDDTYATLQGTASGGGDFLYNFITGVIAPVVIIRSLVHDPLISSMQWADKQVVQGLFKQRKPWLNSPKFLMTYAVAITGFSGLMIPILSKYIDPAISQFVNDVVYRFSNKFPIAYHQQKEALAAELTTAELKPEKKHSKEGLKKPKNSVVKA